MTVSKLVTSYSIYRTAAGFGVLAASESGLVDHRLPFGTSTVEEARAWAAECYPFATGESALTRTGVKLLEAYFAGEPVSFDLPLDLGGFTSFQKEVYHRVFGIGYGKVMSYGEVAAACGSPKGARAIGGAMARNRLPVIIPCHRVLAGNGQLTGFTAPGGVASKKDLLVMEGADFNARGALKPLFSGRL
ncbi:methylated-DNA--[protein]-cysteine S-methyltransferase [Geomonas sp. Red32]|uniref:methylated-DNA--[protein]-cysteine S-methyltransferase n=1 Tax=Geomonas sp. Red32 TaxID=2912856 RepID=UPI00202CD8E9|nr:methylated-DNA--[protein]-cysteine S-methyltransferase [Geomonas sp. Red32]MCM0082496.1 methylated-DNA--[protein]-cysteine S-methyltransferase [Geomonas sp. Red32]